MKIPLQSINPIITSLIYTSVLFFSTAALAVELADNTDDGIEINRSEQQLTDLVRTHPVDPDVVNTALIFTSQNERGARVRCIGFDTNGHPIGRAWLRVPPRGLRFLMASDLSNGTDFIGSAKCQAEGHLVASGFVFARNLTDVHVKQAHHWGETRMRFPVIASY